MSPNVVERVASVKDESPPQQAESSSTEAATDVDVSFSHIHMYVDQLEDLAVYKAYEDELNQHDYNKSKLRLSDPTTTIRNDDDDDSTYYFHSENRDIVKQLLAGFGFRVVAYRYNNNEENTRTVLVTSNDSNGVQFVISAIHHDDKNENSVGETSSSYHHYFDASHIRQFLQAHNHRQGIAVLGFRVNNVHEIEQRYRRLHPQLLLSHNKVQSYNDNVKVLEVFAYYQGDKTHERADPGTMLRFIEIHNDDDVIPSHGCILPGLTPVPAQFERDAQPAYCDHWVSNVISRTGFLHTLHDTLGFTPKQDFNAGVVAAGEAQIESTVTGNQAKLITTDKQQALQDQSQVYLPINNALSQVGHVHGFLREIGQGVQHVASRVDDLIGFVQRANDRRKVLGEGFTFLQIPRSYYGTLAAVDLQMGMADGESIGGGVTAPCANAVIKACEKGSVVTLEGAVGLELTRNEIDSLIDANIESLYLEEYRSKKETVLDLVLRSRYVNLYKLLRHHLSEESYLGLVRNQILVDVQGDDLLYQIFTCNILQRESGEEAPFLEFIQRVCSECKDETGCPVKLKPGCGGFGVRNFLTLFLSIEVSKAMMDAKSAEDERRRVYANEMVDCFTSQLNESNPILTEISDAMTEEGHCKEQLAGDLTIEERTALQEKLDQASKAKAVANQKLLECSTKYKLLMRSIREKWSSNLEQNA